ncbi:MAG: hypothetical protein QM811_02390 [Pirellulales bacterium]
MINRQFNGFNATRWRQWPGNDAPTQAPTPPVGINAPKSKVPSTEKELELPKSPATGGSPNDLPPPTNGVVRRVPRV